jgi:hypothetical protein
MTAELKTLVKQWKNELTYRDCGEAAGKTWAKIAKIATPQEQVKLLRGRD